MYDIIREWLDSINVDAVVSKDVVMTSLEDGRNHIEQAHLKISTMSHPFSLGTRLLSAGSLVVLGST